MRDKALGPVRRKILNMLLLCLFLGGATLFLSGCTTHPRPQPATVPPAPSLTMNVIELTSDELRRIEDRAYADGFEAGRAYERQHLPHQQPDAAPPLPTATKLQPAPANSPQLLIPPLIQPQLLTPPPAKPPAQAPAAPSHTPLPPAATTTSIYSPSGPARPLEHDRFKLNLSCSRHFDERLIHV